MRESASCGSTGGLRGSAIRRRVCQAEANDRGRATTRMRRRRRRRGHRRARDRRASCSLRHDGMRVAVLEREDAHRRPPDQPQLRRHPRRHLLRARLAEGAAVRARARATCTPTARSTASGDERCGKLIVAHARGRAARPRRARAPRPRERRARPARGSAPTRSRRSSRTPRASPRCTRRRPASSTSRAVAARASRERRAARGGSDHAPAARSRASRAGRRGSRVVHALRQRPRARAAIFCAGAWSDRLAVAAGADARPADRPLPRRLPAAPARAARPRPLGRSTRCPTRTCRSSACTSPARSTATSCSARRR